MLTIGADLAKLHQNGIIHGDLTTSNLVLSFNSRQQRDELAYSTLVG